MVKCFGIRGKQEGLLYFVNFSKSLQTFLYNFFFSIVITNLTSPRTDAFQETQNPFHKIHHKNVQNTSNSNITYSIKSKEKVPTTLHKHYTHDS